MAQGSRDKLHWHEFADGGALAEALAETVARRLAAAIETRGIALLAVSGGTTPARFFDHLSRASVDWRKITVTLVDERFVPPSAPRSNQRLVETNLLKGPAAGARFLGLYHEAGSVETAAAQASAAVDALPLPLDVAILGMGDDGHTASFFPDAVDAPSLLTATDGPAVAPVHAPSAGEPRLTLSMPVLTGARFQALHIEGARKRATLEAAIADNAGNTVPIRALIERAPAFLPVYWAPQEEHSP